MVNQAVVNAVVEKAFSKRNRECWGAGSSVVYWVVKEGASEKVVF